MSAPLRIAVMYDGNCFAAISQYYAYHHERRARLSLSALHDFIRERVAACEQVERNRTLLVAAHYFRGRFPIVNDSSADLQRLLNDRRFEDVLVRAGITTHYMPMDERQKEKGIDVWLALEAYELALSGRIDVCALIAGDADFLPLVRKLAALGTRVMVLGWDFKYLDGSVERETRTSAALLDEVSYPVLMSALIEDRTAKAVVDKLFLPSRNPEERAPSNGSLRTVQVRRNGHNGRLLGCIQNLIVRDELQRFGFITPDAGGENLFFGELDVVGAFDELCIGDRVSFLLGTNARGVCAKQVCHEEASSERDD
ncbi:MAG: NYN domain-containing protein [Myxococcota bacterium]|nr:NYN domain-containing protein [Myxococcota bacterium]